MFRLFDYVTARILTQDCMKEIILIFLLYHIMPKSENQHKILFSSWPAPKLAGWAFRQVIPTFLYNDKLVKQKEEVFLPGTSKYLPG